MNITYDRKQSGLYAKLCRHAERQNGKIQKQIVNLGKVIDKERGIYQNRERGVYLYNLEKDEFVVLEPEYQLPGQIAKEKLILDFGDIYLLDTYLKQEKYFELLDGIDYRNTDTLYAMLGYYILCTTAMCYALDWWEGSYARILYPKANLTSQRVSEFLSAIGNETCYRGFFSKYIPYISSAKSSGSNILIDSTGLPNSIRFPLTAVSNHNGEISNEVRLIYVTQQETGLPIYFRYCPGNVIDVSTLIRTILELKESGINTKFAILDAGYYDGENIEALYKNKVSFVCRLKMNLKLYKNLVKEHLGNIQQEEYLVNYNQRFAYIKRVKCELVPGFDAYAYVGLDIDRKSSETAKLFAHAASHKMSRSEVFEEMSSQVHLSLYLLVLLLWTKYFLHIIYVSRLSRYSISARIIQICFHCAYKMRIL